MRAARKSEGGRSELYVTVSAYTLDAGRMRAPQPSLLRSVGEGLSPQRKSGPAGQTHVSFFRPLLHRGLRELPGDSRASRCIEVPQEKRRDSAQGSVHRGGGATELPGRRVLALRGTPRVGSRPPDLPQAEPKQRKVPGSNPRASLTRVSSATSQRRRGAWDQFSKDPTAWSPAFFSRNLTSRR